LQIYVSDSARHRSQDLFSQIVLKNL